MSGGPSCGCRPRDKSKWRCTAYRHNVSAFNGYHHTPSDWSEVRCLGCGAVWRTKAAYVNTLLRATREEWRALFIAEEAHREFVARRAARRPEGHGGGCSCERCRKVEGP